MNNFNKALIAEVGLITSSVTTALLNENEDEIREQVVLLKLLVEDLESSMTNNCLSRTAAL